MGVPDVRCLNSQYMFPERLLYTLQINKCSVCSALDFHVANRIRRQCQDLKSENSVNSTRFRAANRSKSQCQDLKSECLEVVSVTPSPSVGELCIRNQKKKKRKKEEKKKEKKKEEGKKIEKKGRPDSRCTMLILSLKLSRLFNGSSVQVPPDYSR